MANRPCLGLISAVSFFSLCEGKSDLLGGFLSLLLKGFTTSFEYPTRSPSAAAVWNDSQDGRNSFLPARMLLRPLGSNAVFPLAHCWSQSCWVGQQSRKSRGQQAVSIDGLLVCASGLSSDCRHPSLNSPVPLSISFFLWLPYRVFLFWRRLLRICFLMLLGHNTILTVKPRVCPQSTMTFIKEASSRQRHCLRIIWGLQVKSKVALWENVYGPSNQTFSERKLLSERTKGTPF